MRICVTKMGGNMALVDMCIASARYHHPDAVIVHLTDEKTKQAEGSDEVWRLPWDGTPEGALRVRAAHMCNLDNDETVILDDDTIVCDRLDDAFDRQYHVGLTWRNKSNSKYNCGVMFSMDPSFWREWKRLMDDRVLNWGDEQEVLDLMATDRRWRIRDLPCDTWNNSQIDEKVVPKAKVLHYKGNLKDHMPTHFYRGVWKGSNQ